MNSKDIQKEVDDDLVDIWRKDLNNAGSVVVTKEGFEYFMNLHPFICVQSLDKNNEHSDSYYYDSICTKHAWVIRKYYTKIICAPWKNIFASSDFYDVISDIEERERKETIKVMLESLFNERYGTNKLINSSNDDKDGDGSGSFDTDSDAKGEAIGEGTIFKQSIDIAFDLCRRIDSYGWKNISIFEGTKYIKNLVWTIATFKYGIEHITGYKPDIADLKRIHRNMKHLLRRVGKARKRREIISLQDKYSI